MHSVFVELVVAANNEVPVLRKLAAKQTTSSSFHFIVKMI